MSHYLRLQRRLSTVLRGPSLLAGTAIFALMVLGCGAKDVGLGFERGETVVPDEGVAVGECRTAADCDVTSACSPPQCVDRICIEGTPIVCDDNDPCTSDACNPQSGACVFEPRTFDLDGDGFRQPLPGFTAGDPGACGDDCNDQSAAAHPGGVEVCDGVDNDCNGITDDAYGFHKTGDAPRLIAESEKGVESGGLVYADDEYLFFVSAHDSKYQARLLGVDPSGGERFSADVSLTNSDTFAGGIQWTGQVAAVVWEDRRDNDYEIYFNRFDRDGEKLDPDLRISDAPGFSLDPTLHFTGSDYVVLWSDERAGGNDFRVFGQRLGLLGEPIGVNLNLTPDFFGAKSPALAGGETELGLVFNAPNGDGTQLVFRTVAYDLSQMGPATVLSASKATGGGAVYASGRYAVFWSEYDSGPGDSIWGAVVDTVGNVLVGAQRVTAGGGFARSHSALSLGDRILLAWANDWGDSYDIYLQTYSLQLEPLGEVQRMTTSSLDVLGPQLRIADDGVIALSYTERSDDHGPRVWLETLTCR